MPSLCFVLEYRVTKAATSEQLSISVLRVVYAVRTESLNVAISESNSIPFSNFLITCQSYKLSKLLAIFFSSSLKLDFKPKVVTSTPSLVSVTSLISLATPLLE